MSCLHKQVNICNLQRIMYTAKVIAHARRVPWGMATLGFLRSPEILAPATERDRGGRYREGGWKEKREREIE